MAKSPQKKHAEHLVVLKSEILALIAEHQTDDPAGRDLLLQKIESLFPDSPSLASLEKNIGSIDTQGWLELESGKRRNLEKQLQQVRCHANMLRDSILYTTTYLAENKLNSIGFGSKAHNVLLGALVQTPETSALEEKKDAFGKGYLAGYTDGDSPDPIYDCDGRLRVFLFGKEKG